MEVQMNLTSLAKFHHPAHAQPSRERPNLFGVD